MFFLCSFVIILFFFFSVHMFILLLIPFYVQLFDTTQTSVLCSEIFLYTPYFSYDIMIPLAPIYGRDGLDYVSRSINLRSMYYVM